MRHVNQWEIVLTHKNSDSKIGETFLLKKQIKHEKEIKLTKKETMEPKKRHISK